MTFVATVLLQVVTMLETSRSRREAARKRREEEGVREERWSWMREFMSELLL